MHEHPHAEPLDFAPERLVSVRVEKRAVVLGRDHHALTPELVPTAVEFLERFGAAERVGVRGRDEAAGVVLFGLLGLVVDEPRAGEVRAHALRAREPGGVDPGRVHHAHVLVEIVEQLVDRIARRALGIVVQDQPVARILLDQFARREVVLEIDDHRRSLSMAVLPIFSHGGARKRGSASVAQRTRDRDLEGRLRNVADRGLQLVARNAMRLLPE